MVMISAFVAALCPLISSETGISLAVIFSAAICFLVWFQEIWIIQIVFRDDNIDFTRRFYERYPRKGASILYAFLPPVLIIILIAIICFQIGYQPSPQGCIISILLFMTSIRIFDPLLGCINTFDSIPWTGMLAYFAVFLFATTSALDPSKFAYIPLPSDISEALILALLTVVILNLRMAYYERFCFLRIERLEEQLKIVLIPLVILSVTQIIGIMQGLDIATNLNG